jgi:glycerol-3-phosphate dehydrogenase (NAD+)
MYYQKKKRRKRLNHNYSFPLMTAIYRIIYENAPPESIALDLRTHKVTVEHE